MTAITLQKATPDDLTITVRDRRFGRGDTRSKGTDPVAAAWFLALSASFPRGEAMFIEAVKLFRDDAPENLAREIREFIKQEINHSREHIAFNRMASEAGYDIANVEARINAMADETQTAPPIIQLGVTMGLEHFTAIIAHLFLTDPASIVSDGIGDPELWRWHAVEEIEHKGVAYDTWLHATRDWTPRKRYMVRSLIMLRTSKRFISNRVRDALEILAQDGITGMSARWKLFKYLEHGRDRGCRTNQINQLPFSRCLPRIHTQRLQPHGARPAQMRMRPRLLLRRIGAAANCHIQAWRYPLRRPTKHHLKIRPFGNGRYRVGIQRITHDLPVNFLMRREIGFIRIDIRIGARECLSHNTAQLPVPGR